MLTNDGNAILREIDVVHPAAKSIIELSRAQDENVGDGTTSVVILGILLLPMSPPHLSPPYYINLFMLLIAAHNHHITTSLSQRFQDIHNISLDTLTPIAGEMLQIAEPFLEKQIHPTVIIRGFFHALEDATEFLDKFAVKLDPNSRPDMLKVVRSCLSTKFVSRWGDLMCNLALDAVQTVSLEQNGRREVDIKRYAKVEKV